MLRRTPGANVRVLDPLGFTCRLQVNHLQPLFNNPGVRRALLGAVDQSAFMTAVAGGDPAYQNTACGYFCPARRWPAATDWRR